DNRAENIVDVCLARQLTLRLYYPVDERLFQLRVRASLLARAVQVALDDVGDDLAERDRVEQRLGEVLGGEAFWVAAQQNVGAAARHARRDRDRARAPRLRDDERLALVVLGVQHLMIEAHLRQDAAQLLRRLHRAGADQDRAAPFVDFLNLLRN